MKKSLKILLVILILFISTAKADDEKSLEIYLKGADCYFLIVTGIGTCQNCINGIYNSINCIRAGINFKFKTIALVVCDRKIELKLFRRKHPEIDNVVMFNPEYPKKYNFSEESMFIILDREFKPVMEYSLLEMEKHNVCEEVKNLLKNYSK